MSHNKKIPCKLEESRSLEEKYKSSCPRRVRQENKMYGGLHNKIFQGIRMSCNQKLVAIHKMQTPDINKKDIMLHHREDKRKKYHRIINSK